MAAIYMLGLVVLSVTVAFGGTVSDSNSYIDTILQQPFHQELPNSYLDPYPLHEITYEFKKLGANVKATYKEGVMKGFSLVHREGNCGAPRYTPGFVSLNCTLALDNVNVEYQGKVKYGILPKIRITGKGTFSRTLIFVEVSQRPPYFPEITQLNIMQMGTFSSEHTGLGPANTFLSPLKERFERVVAPQLYAVVYGRFKEVLQRSVTKLALPRA